MQDRVRNYINGQTVITAEDLNAIQDAIIENSTSIGTQATQISGKAEASALTAETTAREAAVTAEATARAAADTAEATARAAADTALTSELNDVKSATSDLPTMRANIAANTSDIADLGDAIDAVEVELDGKVDKGGSASDLTAGSAEQLLSSTGVEDAVPYSFRQTCGGGGGGTRVDEEIVGGTICWNQLVNRSRYESSTGKTQNGVTFTVNEDGSVTANGTATETTTFGFGTVVPTMVAGHIYLFQSKFDDIGSANTFELMVLRGGGTATTSSNFDLYRAHAIYRYQYTGNVTQIIQFAIRAGATVNNLKCTPQFYDLTQMFGTAVADQIYAMETASAGAGVAYFRSLFPAEFYAYKSGELMSVNAARKETVGLNMWDGEYESGYYDIADGSASASSPNWARSKNPVPCLPNTSYYFTQNESAGAYGWMVFYGASGDYLGQDTAINLGSYINTRPFTTPANAHFMKFYNNPGRMAAGACIGISDPSRNGTYEPYQKHSYPLDSTLTLRGVPKLDANNGLCYDGDEYKPDGTVTRKYGIVDLGTLNWAYDSAKAFFYSTAIADALAVTYTSLANCITAKYLTVKGASYNGGIDKTVSINDIYGDRRVGIKDSAYTDAATFKAAMSGVYLVYELATPTTETAEPYQQIQVVDPLGTEEYVDASVLAGTRDVAVPVGHNSLYMTDLRKKIENIPGDFSTLLAPIEAEFKATRAYAVNEFLIVNSQLYKVTASIANGATITPGTNVTATTVGAVLTALLNS